MLMSSTAASEIVDWSQHPYALPATEASDMDGPMKVSQPVQVSLSISFMPRGPITSFSDENSTAFLSYMLECTRLAPSQ